MQKLIKINTDHYIIVDESKQPVEGYYYDSFINKIKNTNGAEYGEAKHCWQIIYSTQPLELLTLSENGLSGMGFSKVKPLNIFNVKELIGKVDVEKKAEEWFLINQYNQQDMIHSHRIPEYITTKNLWVTSYNQALEDNKDRKYTEDDLRNAYRHGTTVNHGTKEHFNSFIQSLQPKTEWEVEIVDGKLKLK